MATRAEKLKALAELKKTRSGGSRTLKEEDTQIYDEVTEDQYKSIVKGRLQKDDFVVDDGVEGYMDNGMDDWTGGREEDEESEEEIDRKKKAKKKLKETNGKSKGKPKPPPPPAPAPSITKYRPVVSVEQESDFMSSLMGELEAAPITARPSKRSLKRKSSPTSDDDLRSSSPVHSGGYKTIRRQSSYVDLSSDAPMDDSFDVDRYSPRKKTRVDEDGALTPATEQFASLDVHSSSDFELASDASFDDIDMSAFMDIDEDEFEVKPKVKAEPIEKFDIESKKPSKSMPKQKEEVDTKPSWLSVYDSLSVANEDTLGSLHSASASQSASSPNKISALESDGSLRFFWLDYLEHEGKLYFIGKLKDKETGVWVSCCVTVENMERNLYVLPREKRVEQDEDGEIHETDQVPSMEDVRADFEMIRKELKIKSWRARPVKRRYAFGETDVPRGESEWLKVVYGFNEAQVPMSACSPNISRIFGTNTSAFELLVLKRKIMGPCWLQIKNPQVEHKGVSWCKLEVTVTDPKDINPFAETDAEAPRETPPLTVMSLSVRSIVNHQENKREVVCTTARIWHNMQLDDPTPPERLPCTVQTFVRPLDQFPPNFEKEAKANGRGFISPMKNERMLLNTLLVAIYKADPDVIVGHDFLGVSLDVLLHRMRDLKADHWSRLGRFRRSKWPNIGKQGSNIRFLNGRMLCDLASDGAKSMIASTTWSLTEMCKTHLNSERQDIDPDDTASYLDGSLSTPDNMLTFVRHCELDAHYQMAIASKVQMLPLTKQLTNLAGNSWNKTLNGGRAERNEYILLHEFHRLKYICPDKTWGKKSAAVKETQDEDGEGNKTKSKRDKYKGGLVFEPKRGLWDKFILVMDFNSLYPSIIQEYNIDFTTVEKAEDDENGDERIPEPPVSEVSQGVLPRLIATLVSRRKQVKSLMKDKSVSHAKLLQYDIKQQALKLTANSMYGCLGFEYSRFYARPLAALTTYKGREILTHTRELAETLNLDVVYGDTDSVFVNSNVTELSEALKISAAFKKVVNDRYRLLEIDLDGVFQRLLLLQKKKYAAIKVEDAGRTTTEIKGLDMKRREYCALSKTVSQYVLDQILSGEATENVVENIHEYLTTISENVRGGKVKVEDFIVFKRLGKNPEDYPDAKSQPHVQVALRMKTRGGTAHSGDVIPYIFCLAEGEESAKSAQADRAKHPDELRRAGAELKIDYEHYLSQQVLPPIERLCEPIEGTDRARLAECLGLDPLRYRHSVGVPEERVFSALDSQISDAERFKDVQPFIISCRSCQGHMSFVPINEQDPLILTNSGAKCPACQNSISLGSLEMQLETHIREYISKYYEGWTICNDPTCGNRTRMMSVYGRRCLRPGCRGTVAFEYSDTQLYNQLRYFSFLFDDEKAVKAAQGSGHLETITALVGFNRPLLTTLSNCTEKYLEQCGRRWVDLSSIFSVMKV
ncbi:DNA polymerase alpha catalytic subunit [Crucibulum laeve]|uniref:DNA polymerase n=1 Tax=Crucibulum laeve TaxID=68775 RepID=A0A5C3M2L7_9AGAR|nr:DNA polymerase alpha catalytic subunit [Crucibulum laeve]